MKNLTEYDIFSLKVSIDRSIQDMSLLISELFSKVKTQKHVSTSNNWQDEKCCVHFMVNGSFRTEAIITMSFLKDDTMIKNSILTIMFNFELYDKRFTDIIDFFDYFKSILNISEKSYYFSTAVNFNDFKDIKSRLNVEDYELWRDSSKYNL